LDAFREFEVSGWEKVGGAGYHRFAGLVTGRVIDPLLDAARVVPKARVLDVATGPGYVAQRAAGRGASVIGVDISAPMVELASKMHPTIEFRQADAEKLPFDGASFDAVVSNFILGHLAYPDRTVVELARVLTLGGFLALSWWDVPERARFLGLFVDAVREAGALPPPDLPPGPPMFRFSVDQELSGLLAVAGLQEIEVRAVSFTHRISGSGEMWDGMLGGTVRTRALIVGQTEEMQRRIRAALDRLLLPYAVDDGFEIPVSVKIAAGKKP
jgi:SAM-dependent methyltransferase